MMTRVLACACMDVLNRSMMRKLRMGQRKSLGEKKKRKYNFKACKQFGRSRIGARLGDVRLCVLGGIPTSDIPHDARWPSTHPGHICRAAKVARAFCSNPVPLVEAGGPKGTWTEPQLNLERFQWLTHRKKGPTSTRTTAHGFGEARIRPWASARQPTASTTKHGHSILLPSVPLVLVDSDRFS
jgi:hypothetical protein